MKLVARVVCDGFSICKRLGREELRAHERKRARDVRTGAFIFASLACWPKLLRHDFAGVPGRDSMPVEAYKREKKSGKTLSCEACLRASVLQAASSHQPRLCQTGAIRATRRPGKHSPLNTEAAAAALGTRELKAAARWSKSRISCQPLARDSERARAAQLQRLTHHNKTTKINNCCKKLKPWRPRPTRSSRY